jgi:threonine aldolase
MRSFGSDNHSGVHPKVMDALVRANADHAVAYGADPWTARATALFQREFGAGTEVFFVFGGTGANVVSLAPFLRPYEAVICPAFAHLWVHECGAPEGVTGCKLIPVAAPDGKLTVDLIRPHLAAAGDPHETQPRVVSVSQSTERGLLYTPAELRAIADFVHAHGLWLHVDGARLANAAASLGLGLRECSRDAGVDALSFGGTKNGLMFGEAVVFFGPAPAREAPFLRKRAMQLASKQRFIAAQMEALLTDELWRANAAHANRMAARLAARLGALPGVELAFPVQTNMVFTRLAPSTLAALRQRQPCSVVDETGTVARWVASFDTTEEDLAALVADVAACGAP